MRRRHALALAGLPLMARAGEAQPELRLGATQWAPYSIGQGERPGWLHEHLRAELALMGIRLRVVYLPWTRALALAREGLELDGLLTAVPAEAEGLRLTSTPTVEHEIVLLTRSAESWRYQGPGSLPELRLGVAADYGYGEPLDRYLRAHPQSERVLRLTGDRVTERLLRLLDIGRIEALAEDRMVLHWTAAQLRLPLSRFREAAAFGAQPVFLALNPKLPALDALLARLNEHLASPARLRRLQRLRERYLQPAG